MFFFYRRLQSNSFSATVQADCNEIKKEGENKKNKWENSNETYMYGTTYATKHIKAVIRVRKKQYNVSNHVDY